MTNTIAISQNLVDAGLELKAANAIAVAMDSNVDDRLATKTDLAKMDTKIEVIETKINVSIALMIGLFIVFIADILMR